MRPSRWAALSAFSAMILYAGLAGADGPAAGTVQTTPAAEQIPTAPLRTAAPSPRPFWSAGAAPPTREEPPGRFDAAAHYPAGSGYPGDSAGRHDSAAFGRQPAVSGDGEVSQAAWVAPASPLPRATDAPPPSAAEVSAGAARDKEPSTSRSRPLPLAPRGNGAGEPGDTGRGRAGPWVTVVGSLALVLGLFFVFAWALRRTGPRANVALPAEVFEVLGRAPLAARQEVHLLRCGTKLLLVSVTPAGAETLTEITEAAEVDRLAGLCQQARPGSATATFRDVLQQLTGHRGDRLSGAELAPERPVARGLAAGASPAWEPRDA